jgi:hypothetical protein
VPRITLMKPAKVKEAPRQGCHAACRSPPDAEVSQHEAGAAGATDAVAEIISCRARVGADPHLIEGVVAAAAHH